jgi:hypothetical protein
LAGHLAARASARDPLKKAPGLPFRAAPLASVPNSVGRFRVGPRRFEVKEVEIEEVERSELRPDPESFVCFAWCSRRAGFPTRRYLIDA